MNRNSVNQKYKNTSRTNIIITSASREISLIRTFQNALRQTGGGKIIAADMSPYAPALYFADEHALLPSTDQAEFLEAVLHLCKKFNVKLLFSPRDEEVLFYAKHRRFFTQRGIRVMVPKLETVRICQDKKLFVEFCQKNGFCTPETYDKEILAKNVSYPLFVKPRFGKASKHTYRVDSKETLRAVLKILPNAIIQKYMDVQEYTIDLFADFSGNIISVVPRKRIRVFGGESFVGKTSNNPFIIEESVRLALKLALIGHNTIQCFFDKTHVKFTEVNPRFGGGAHLGFAAGAPTPLFLVKLIKGERLRPMIGKFKNNLCLLRYTQDLFMDAKKLRSKKVL